MAETIPTYNLQFKRHWAGYYTVIRKEDGAPIATIEHSKVQDCCEDPNEWLLTYRKPDWEGDWVGFEGEICLSYRDCRNLAIDWAHHASVEYPPA